jgi:hypothetical protein
VVSAAVAGQGRSEELGGSRGGVVGTFCGRNRLFICSGSVKKRKKKKEGRRGMF